MRRRIPLRSLGVSALVLAAFLVAACGEDDENGGVARADVAGARDFIAPFVGQPSDFPVTEPLDERPAKGTRVAFLDVGTPTSAFQWDLIQPAAKTMGFDIYQVRAGAGAEGISSALDTIVEQMPEGMIFLATDPTLFSRQLEQLREGGTTVVTGGIVNGKEFGFETVQFGRSDAIRLGENLVAWALARSDGEARNVVFYTVPELEFASVAASGAMSKMEELCPDCTLRVVDIPLAEVGRGATERVVSDLQANPDTDFALFATDEIELGLPAALQTAGIDIPTIGAGATPGNLEAIKQGQQDASLGSDTPTLMWTIIDQLAREMAGQELAGPEAEGTIVLQFLTEEDITFDPSTGWTGYPDFAERFAKLWGVEQGQ